MTDQTELERLKAEMDAARKAAQVAGVAEREAADAARAAARATREAWEAAQNRRFLEPAAGEQADDFIGRSQ